MNKETKATEEKLGPFLFDPDDGIINPMIVNKGPIELENGAVYIGQWNRNGFREGIGTQIWKDGSKFTGYWRNDNAHGRGRLIHQDGDCYEGEWVEGKA